MNYSRLRPWIEPLRAITGPRLYKRWFGSMPVVGPMSVDVPDLGRIRLVAGKQDEIAERLYFDGFEGFEPETVRLFLRLCRGASVILDIGANTGYYALLAGLAAPAARIYGFEPVPGVHRLFEASIRLNGFSNIRAIEAAATDFNGEITLHVPASQETPSSASTREGFRRKTRPIQVKAIRAEDFLAAEGAGPPDLIKIDTESTEPAALEGLRGVLERRGPPVICEVLAGRTENDLMNLLGPLGYRYFHITGAGLVPRERIEGDRNYQNLNYLFTRDDPPAAA